MALTLKTFSDFANLITGKFKKEIPEIDPTIDASLARAATVSSAAAAFSNQEGLRDAIDQAFWQTADDDFLVLIGEYDKTTRYTDQYSSGYAAATGTLSEIIEQDQTITYDGNTFIVSTDSSIQEYTGDVSLSYSSGIVTAECDSDHTMSTGLSVTISGATQDDYNGTYEITVLDSETFTYEIDDTTLTTDNGSYSSEYALLLLESSDPGSDQNVGAGATMTIDQDDIDEDILVGVEGITGGLDEEDIDDYRIRVGENHNITPGISTPPSLKASAKSYAGNTRVWIIRPDGESGGTAGEAGYKPELGETVIYVLRDDDDSITPTTTQLTATKDQILDDGLWPSFIPDDYLYVLAPTLTEQDFTFTSITPNTTTMQTEIESQLDSFFEDYAEVGGTIDLDDLNQFLRLIQDPSDGQYLTDFTYTTPSDDMDADDGEILILGDVTWDV